MTAALFAVALVVLCGLEQRLQPASLPQAFRGLPIALLNAGTFLVSAVCIAAIRVGGSRRDSEEEAEDGGSWLASLRHTLPPPPRRAFLMMIAAQQTMAYLMVFVCNTLLPAFVSRELEADAGAFGLIEAGWGAGAILGALMLGRVLRSLSPGTAGTLCLLVLGLGTSLLCASSSVAQATALYAALGCLGVMTRINADTMIAQLVDPRHFGKFKSAVVFAISWTSLMAYGVTGWLGDQVSVRVLYQAMGGVFLALGVMMLLRPARFVDTDPMSPDQRDRSRTEGARAPKA